MAVKKATAKKSAAKKAAVKKSTPKKAVRKASPSKKAVAKKAVARKSAVKKSAVKKSAGKKAVAKKTVARKSTVKKSAKKTLKKTSAKKAVETFEVPEAPISAQRAARVEIVTTPAPAFIAPLPIAPVLPLAAVATSPNAQKKQGASGRVVFAVVVGIILLGLIVWAKGHNSNSSAKATPTATASVTPTESPTPEPSASDTTVAIANHEAPQGVVAHYTSTGATIYWKAPSAVDGLSGYNVEISVSNGPWKLISTVPAAQLSLPVKKVSSSGWTSFRVSSVYTDSETSSAKAFGLPGTYS